MEEKPNYYAVIPANVRYDENLKLGEKMMFGEITSLANKTGVCYASNNYFANLYKVTPQAISKWVKALEKNNYITISYEKEGKLTTRRIVKIVQSEVSTDIDTINSSLEGYQQEIKDNNTSINNNKENINNKLFIKENFKKPTLEEVQEYCRERGNTIDAEYFIDYYESKGWLVGKTKMKDWKAAIRLWEHKSTKKVDKQKEIDEMCKRLAYLDEE